MLERKISLRSFSCRREEAGFLFPGEMSSLPELIYVVQGSLHSVCDGQEMLLREGNLALYGAGQWHMHYADLEVEPRYVTITFEFPGGDLSPLLNRKLSASPETGRLLQQMLEEQERQDSYSEELICAEFSVLLLLFLRRTESEVQRQLSYGSGEQQIIRRAQQYISTHIREKLSVPLVARQVDVSPSYLTALFHKNLQISPGEYIRRIKLQESKQMIRENDLNFTEIAEVLQYSTVHHFSRQFKEKFGITPTEYAKSVR